MAARVVLKMRQSIDGFVCSANNDDSFLFAHIDEEALAWEAEHLWRAGVHVMGRMLYQSMAAYWPTSNMLPAAPMNQIPKAVFSKTLTEAAWGPVEVLRGDLTTEMSALKDKTDKDIFVHGGASLAQSLSHLGLIDEYRLLIHPVTLVRGKACITSPAHFRLISSHRFASGVVALTYARDA
jgi:dihydrofolate reductase